MDKLRPWKEGDERQFAGSKYKIKVREGLYWYHGFGCGEWFSSDGNVYWGTSSELRTLASVKGEGFEWVDSLQGYKPTYLGD